MKNLFLIPVLISIIFLSNNLYSFEKKYKFKDQTIADEETGITIMTNETKDVIIVSNSKLHYALIFPYLANWEFLIDDQYAIFGNGKKINVSLQIFKNNNDNSKMYLTNLKKSLESNKSKNGVIEAKILNVKNSFILRTIVDPTIIYKNDTFKNIKQINYFTTKTYKDTRYVYHSSVIIENNTKVNENDFFNFATEGFFIDFERN